MLSIWNSVYISESILRHRINPALVKIDELISEETSPQVKRCVRAIASRDIESGSDARTSASKAFAICTSQMQKNGYVKKGTNFPTQKGKRAGRSKAADKTHSGKLQQYKDILAMARGDK